jgi:hypothetical protein
LIHRFRDDRLDNQKRLREYHDLTEKETPMSDTTQPDAAVPTSDDPKPLSFMVAGNSASGVEIDGKPVERSNAEVSMSPTLWRDGPIVKITSPSRGLEKYKSRALVDASAILFVRDPEEQREEWNALESHPLSSIARSIERCEWHTPSAKALQAIGSSPTVGGVCLFGLETHFVREPLGNTFSACRLGLCARELGGMSMVAVVGLALGDVLLVKGATGYAAIAKRSQPVSGAPVLWTLADAQTATK